MGAVEVEAGDGWAVPRRRLPAGRVELIVSIGVGFRVVSERALSRFRVSAAFPRRVLTDLLHCPRQDQRQRIPASLGKGEGRVKWGSGSAPCGGGQWLFCCSAGSFRRVRPDGPMVLRIWRRKGASGSRQSCPSIHRPRSFDFQRRPFLFANIAQGVRLVRCENGFRIALVHGCPRYRQFTRSFRASASVGNSP